MSVIKKVSTLFIFFTLLMLFASLKVKSYDKELDTLELLTGKISIASDPVAYFHKTQLGAITYDKDWQFAQAVGILDQPIVFAESALVVDLTTGHVLYEKEPTKKLRIASLTKIMTAVIALEHKKKEHKIYISRPAAYVGEDTMYITTGEVYTLEELLYGLLLNSGNDAAYAIAEGIAVDVPTFITWMNLKAQELGLTDTLFADPSGLDDSTYSTVTDLVKLSKYAMQNPDFAKIVATTELEISGTTHKPLILENATNLLKTYPDVLGIKTGYTEAAGLCLVTYARNEGHDLLGVVLNSIDRKGDMVLILDHGFSVLGIDIVHNF